MKLKVVVILFLKVYVVNSAVFLWSNRAFDLSPLIPFDDDDLKDLILKNQYQKVFKYFIKLPNPTDLLPKNIQPLLQGYYSAYNPNGQIKNVSNATGICSITQLSMLTLITVMTVQLYSVFRWLYRSDTHNFTVSAQAINSIPNPKVLTLQNGQSKFCNAISNVDTIQKIISKVENGTSFIAIINILNQGRSKRSLEVTPTAIDSTPQENAKASKPEGPVIYKGQNLNNNLYALMYSSKPLMFKVKNTIKYLGNTRPEMITVDTRLNVRIPLVEDKITTLRFSFTWVNGYWYLPSVKITDINDKMTYNLTTDENIMAPAHFSYHCNGQSVFTDTVSGAELYIYDLQVQIESKDGKFGDANDCVSFTTAPIWSGLFVTTILGLGLIIALTAIMDIKTMDKFDNHKTKNIAITVSD